MEHAHQDAVLLRLPKLVTAATLMSKCQCFLDREPQTQVTPSIRYHLMA